MLVDLLFKRSFRIVRVALLVGGASQVLPGCGGDSAISGAPRHSAGMGGKLSGGGEGGEAQDGGRAGAGDAGANSAGAGNDAGAAAGEAGGSGAGAGAGGDAGGAGDAGNAGNGGDGAGGEGLVPGGGSAGASGSGGVSGTSGSGASGAAGTGGVSGTSGSGGSAGSGGSSGTSGSGGDGTSGSSGVSGASGTSGSGGSGVSGSGGSESGAGGSSGGVAGSGATGGGGSTGGGGDNGGEPCVDSAEVIASVPQAWGLALDAGDLYFTTHALDGGIYRLPVSGGQPVLLSSGELYPHDIAASTGRVFWAAIGQAAGHLFQAASDGSDRHEIATGVLTGIFSLNADANNIYYSTNLNALVARPIAGGPLLSLSEGPFDSAIVDVALHDGQLYWTNYGVAMFEPVQPETALVKRASVDGATAAPLVTRLDFPLFAVAVDESSVYFSDESAVYRTSHDGGAFSPIVSLPPRPLGESALVDMVTDGEHLFYTDGQALLRVPVAGGTPEVLTEGWDRIQRLVFDDENLYFTDSQRGAVVKIAKCATAPGGSEGDPGAGGSGGQAGQGGSAGQAGSSSQGGTGGSAGSCPHGCPEPTPVATIASPFGLAIDESYLYFSIYAVAGSVQRVSLAGGSPEAVVTGQVGPHDIAVDDTYVYSCLQDSQAGHLAKALKGGGPSQTIAQGIANGVGRAISDGAFVYYGSGFNGIYRIHRNGGSVGVVAAGPYGSEGKDLVVAGGTAFWVNDGIFNSNFTAKLPGTAYVAETPVSGTSSLGHTSFAAGLDSPIHRITADAANVYFIDDVSVYRRSLAGGPLTTLGDIAPASGTIIDLHSDGTHVYFADLNGVFRMPVNGGATETLTDGWGSLRAIALDEAFLYFTDFAGGLVLKRPK
ncbi:MAG TPA: hypothetical protein VGK73_38260 [Polyangiaceae bacterium]